MTTDMRPVSFAESCGACGGFCFVSLDDIQIMNHFTDSQISAGIVFLVVISAVAIGVWWRYAEPKIVGISQIESSQAERNSPLSGITGSHHGSMKHSSKKNRVGDGNTPSADDRNQSKVESIDLTETSWLNPFTKAHWLPLKSSETQPSPPWSFDNKSMQCEAGQTAGATFRRPYQNFSIDLHIERPMPTGAFEIRLTAPDSKTMLFAEMTETQLEVSAVEPKRKRTVLKHYTLKVPLSAAKPTRLRFAATGNRIMISHNYRKVLTCNQPAGLSNREVRFSLLSRGSSCRIIRLRIDGE
jgi:hypothetical protein